MKFLRILFLINTLIVLTFFVLLFTSESDNKLTAEFTTEIPKPAAFKLLVKNLTGSSEMLAGLSPATVEFTYIINTSPLTLPYRLQLDEANYRLLLVPQASTDRLFALKDAQHQITLKDLVDGSTNIQWQLNYHVSGWTARLLNRFFWKPALDKFLKKKITDLEKSFAS